MSDTHREALVILGPLVAHSAVEELVGPHGKVMQEVSGRIAVVVASPEILKSLAARPDVDRVLVGSESSARLSSLNLNDAERLFVDAWLSRQGDEPKTRVGDGLDWDESEFDTP